MGSTYCRLLSAAAAPYWMIGCTSEDGGYPAAELPIGTSGPSADRRVHAVGERQDRHFVQRTGREVWAALEQATPRIVDALRDVGVIDAQYVVGFVHPFSVHVWLVTRTDTERDSLPRTNPFVGEVRAAIRESNFPDEHASLDGTVAQSQETVDRDYEGSWFYALR